MMEPVTIFVLKFCPYCRQALSYLEELQKEDRYKDIQINMIDEAKNRALADSYDYYLVPTFFLGRRKLFEGAMEKEDVRNVLEEILSAV